MFTRGFKVEKIIRALLRGKGSRRGVTPTKPTVPNMAAEQPCRIDGALSSKLHSGDVDCVVTYAAMT